MYDDACFVQRMLDGFLCVEDVADLLKGAAPSFDEEEVNDDEFENVPEYEQEVVLVEHFKLAGVDQKASGK